MQLYPKEKLYKTTGPDQVESCTGPAVPGQYFPRIALPMPLPPPLPPK